MIVVLFGLSGDRAVSGDWSGLRRRKIGVYRNGEWHLDYDGDFRWSPGDAVLYFGLTGDLPAPAVWRYPSPK